MFEASFMQHHIISGYIQVVSDGHYLPAFWAHPELGGTFPGLVLLHDYHGLTPHIRTEARRFAEQGYYVIAPDLFNRTVPESPESAQSMLDQLAASALSFVGATLRALISHNKCNGKIGLIGWGEGAGLAFRTAVYRDDLRALVIFYGLPSDFIPAELRMMACPMLALLADHDPDIPAELRDKLRDIIQQTSSGHEVVIYPDVERGFFDDSRPTFQAVAAQDAWTRSLDFLNRHLDVAKPSKPGQFDPGKVY